MIHGIDISVWQDDNSTAQMMDFAKAKAAGARFAFIKTSERMAADPDFMMNWKNAKAAGLPRGGYHFLRWDISGLYQARVFCALLKDDPGELPPVADFEAPIKDGKYPSNALLWQFLEEVENLLGRKPMIYTSPGYWSSYGKIKDTSRFDAKWGYFPLWIAHYTKADKPTVPPPWTAWAFWQYTSTGDGLRYGAESKGLDLNWFNGDQAEFNALLAQYAPGSEIIEPQPEPGTDPTPPPASDYIQAEINLLGARVRQIEQFLGSFKAGAA